jgi:hypothetical protein
MHRLSGLPLLALLAAACTTGAADAPKASTTALATDTAPPPARGSAVIAAGGIITGTVREIIPVESYLYLRLDTVNGELWTAVNEAKLEIGATVTVYNVLPMEQFASPTLNRTFATIYFGSLQPVAPPTTNAVTATTESSDATDAHVGVVAPARGSGAHVIASLWTGRDQLVRTTVAVRGVVVKYNAGVMGKNWIHLQDGSGNPNAGTHDIAATTIETAAVGDTITVMGTVRTNVDVGAGYKYALLLENARIVGR